MTGFGRQEKRNKGRALRLAALLLVTGALAAGAATQASAGGNGASSGQMPDLWSMESGGSTWWIAGQFQIVSGPGGQFILSFTGSVVPAGIDGQDNPFVSSPLPSTAVTDFAGLSCFNSVVTAGVLTPSGEAKFTCRG